MRRRFALLATALAALNAFFWLAQGGFALPRGVIDRFFGPRMVRAEVVVEGGGVARDYRIDRGRIASVAGSSITLDERDGTTVTIDVAPGARIVGRPRLRRLAQLRPGLRVLVVRQANAPATEIQVEGGG